ncbi:amidohydrolase family protein [Conexibacter woesei]|uniref:Amidohydrolase 2 n=1 Tax=Conexibacter woesei (strain DSM 14684 / CCUG 47730 / CIP 108061 / JCM 11494 / NBRC 100937 / ID131577) TaxID=469383 RepID=D3FES3_CONWI|nr:amidohydrolase family protein [Conexibacter woesei]ADB49747.1 amidohydrolase 2 [Conexibacter woesei DSM 14684]
MRIDVHQHLLSPPLLAALARRGAAPSLTRRGDGWTFHLDGEPDSQLAAADADARTRAGQLDGDGVDRALVLLSSALGIEHLPAEEAAPLLDAYHDGAAALPSERFGAWGAIGVREPDPGAVDALLARGFVGVSIPATALATPALLERLGPLLERLERRGAPLFVHPGPVTAPAPGAPAWWPALTDYVAQMNAAWHAFLHAGRPALPRLRVLFAMLAGGAPLQLERLAARGGPAERALDPLTFYDTSSYGPRAVEATLRVVGADQLVHGSDRPVVGAAAPRGDTALGHALLRVNPARLLGRAPTHDPIAA